MSTPHSRKSALVVTALACLLGLGVAGFAANAMASAAPDDTKAYTTGPATALQPADVLGYGG